MDMTSSPVLTRSVLEPYNPVIQDPTQSPLVDLHPFMISQALFIAETYRLLPEIYELLWQTLYKLESQGQMARQSPPAATHNSRRRGPPSPDPEPAAPPVIILSQSGTRRVPRFQVPAADGGVDQGPHPQPQKPTSSPSQQFPPRPPRYHLRSHSRNNNNSRAGGIATSNPPNKPPPEPHPAPPVIILSTNTATSPPPARPASTPTLTPTPAFPASAPAPAPAPAHTPNQPSASSPTPPLPNTMGSKVSKLKEKSAEGKLQPSQARQDKEEMKEPSNYYTTRSKSMRKKAAKGAPDAAPGLP
ncbi:hypothetical protein HRS9139_05338 [Pyrenophora teres f. teres]|nr:hypothetical protein HRS9139_05338 [Pyrenophora teres f. teres]KAE8864208.1 hypothetical protein PTNB29_04172 [Pyrenophora teres f. teres]